MATFNPEGTIDRSQQQTADFQMLLHSQLMTLESILLLEHQRSMSSLRENRVLRQQVFAGESLSTLRPELCTPEEQGPRACNPVLAEDEALGSKEHTISLDDIVAISNLAQVDGEHAGLEIPDTVTDNSRSHVAEKLFAENNTYQLEQVLEEANNDTPRSGKPFVHVRQGSRVFDQQFSAEKDSGCCSWIGRLVFSKEFEIVSGVVILANTILMALHLQYEGFDIKSISLRAPDARSAEDTWPGAKNIFLAFDVIFNVIFCLELLLRIAASRMSALRSGWIRFDLIVIGCSVIDMFSTSALPVNPAMLRVLRLLRMVRLFRILKAMSVFDSLFLLLKSIYSSMNAAVWSFFLLSSVHIITGLFLCQVLQPFLREDEHPLEVRQEVFRYWGTTSRSLFTMFEISMANWAKPCRLLIEQVTEWFIPFVIAYRCFFLFAVLKVMAAIFITETNNVLANDDELTLMKRHREQASFKAKVKQFMRAIDSFDGERIGWTELEEIASDEDVGAMLSTLGFAPQDLKKIFWLIDDGTGHMHVDEFLTKITLFRGQPKTVDMLTLLKITHRLSEKVQYAFGKQGLVSKDWQADLEEDTCCKV